VSSSAPAISVVGDGRSDRPGRWRRPLQTLVLLVPVGLVLGGGWAYRTVVEDGFIYLRVAKQIEAGNGPVFNAGERAEAATGVLWVWMLALADLVIPIRFEWLAVLLGLGATALGVWLAMIGSRRLWPSSEDAWFVPLGALIFAVLAPTWQFATTGLETGLVFLWLGGSFFVLATWATEGGRALPLPHAVLLGLGWLVRPELVIFSAVFLIVVVAAQWRTDTWASRARLVGAMVALPLAYQVFRMGYYGSLVPNTGIAKEGSRLLWDRGWDYLRNFTDPYWLWVPMLGLVVAGYLPLRSALRRVGNARGTLVLVGFIVGGLLGMLYVVVVGGDYTHARLLLPGFFALSAPVAVVPIQRSTMVGLALVPWLVAALFFFRPPLFGGFAAVSSQGYVTTDDYEWGEDGNAFQWYQGPGYYFEQGLSIFGYRSGDPELRPDVPPSFGAFAGVGIASYAPGPDFHVLDLMGLGDSFTAHLEIDPDSTAQAGHEKPLPAAWLAARLSPAGSRPEPDFYPSWRVEPAMSDQAWQEKVAWARAALECDEIRHLLESADAPLTPQRFGRNVLRSFANTRLRIPADPEEAYRRFCGPGTPPEVEAVRGR
jgi:arabinofuranosyltransferase